MGRFFKFLLQSIAVVALAAVASAAIDKTAVPGADRISTGIVAAAGGLVLGLIVAWLRGIDWQRLPIAFRAWQDNFMKYCAWAAVGCVSVAVLVYY